MWPDLIWLEYWIAELVQTYRGVRTRRAWRATGTENFTGEPLQKCYHSLFWLSVLISIVYNKNVYTHGRQYFASWKSSLRAFIWCIYLNFTKNVTYALLVLTPSTSLWSDAFLNALMFSHRFQLFVYCALKRIVHSTYLLADSIPQLIQVFQTSKQRTKNNLLWVNQGLHVPLPVLFPITRKCVAITITNSYIQLKG